MQALRRFFQVLIALALVLAYAAVPSFGAISTVSAAVVPNDTIASATVASFGSYTQNVFGATKAGDDPVPSCEPFYNSTVWFRFTPAFSLANVVFDTDPSSYDTVMAIFTGAPGSLTQIACGDNEIGSQARITLPSVTAGTTYYIMVAKWNSAASFDPTTLVFRIVPPPTNNDIGAAIDISSTAPPYEGIANAGAATFGANDAATCIATLLNNTVWYRYTPNANRRIVLNTEGSDYDTVLSVFTGTPGSLTQIACNDNAINFDESELALNVNAGTTYHIMVGKVGTALTGVSVMRLNMLAVPANDSINSPVIIPASAPAYTSTQSVTGTDTTGDPSLGACTSSFVNSVWFKFTPNLTRTVTVDTINSNFDTVVAVFTGTPGNLTQIACNDNTVSLQSRTSFSAVSGTTYYIMAAKDGTTLAAGTTALQLNLSATPPNDLPTGAEVIPANTTSTTRVIDTRGAYANTGEPFTSCGGEYNAVWYSYTPAATRIVNFSTSGSAYDTVLAIFTKPATTYTQVACNNDASTTDKTSLINGFTAVAGTTYYIMLASNSTSASSYLGILRMNVTVQTCSEALDVAFVLDGSGSILSSDFQLMKGFVKNVVANFQVGPTKARFGVVQFDSRTQVEIDISSDANAIYAELDNMTQLGGSTAIGDGITLGQQRLVANARNGVYRFIVLLTDGQNNSGSNPETAATAIKNAGTRIFGVAVGSGPDLDEINGVASDPDSKFVYTVSDYASLVNVLQSLVSETCVAPRIKTDTIGIFRPTNATFYLRKTNTTGPADIVSVFGTSTDLPVTGDWNADAIDSIGVFRPSTGTWYLKDANTTGAPVVYSFIFGGPGDAPFGGDWDGNQRDGVGVFRNGQLLLRNTLSTGLPDYAVILGAGTDRPVAGDWNGDGIDSPGVYRPSQSNFYLTNQVCNCVAAVSFAATLGNPGDVGIAGDWNGDGAAGIGVFRPTNGRIFLKNVPNTGFADVTIVYGIANDKPVAGQWSLPTTPQIKIWPEAPTAPIFEPKR